MKKVELNTDQTETLEFIAEYYEKKREGCWNIELIATPKSLEILRRKKMVFKTGMGWFPTTLGQQYLRDHNKI